MCGIVGMARRAGERPVDDADADPVNELQTLAEVLGQDNDADGADMLNLGTVNAAAFSGMKSALKLMG